MATTRLKSNATYRDHYQKVLVALIAIIIVVLLMTFVVLYQLLKRPLPVFTAITPSGARLVLTASEEPNLLSSTIIKWSKKAAVAAYTYDFVNYNKQLANVRPYFTEAGWADYQKSIISLIQTIRQGQLFVNSIVVSPPVIANQGDLPGHGYTWRLQIPFLVTYETSETSTKQSFTVFLTIVRVPTKINPAGIGIDQFVMK